MKRLDSLDGIDAHHHFLLSETVLEELLELDAWLALQDVRLGNGKQNYSISHQLIVGYLQ